MIFVLGDQTTSLRTSHLGQQRRALAVAAVVLLLVSCASTPQGKAYQSIVTCNATAQAAVRSFGVLYQTNKAADPATWGARYDKVQAAYASYQKIALAAVDAAAANGDTQVILASVNASLNELTTLLATFGVH